MTSPHSVSEDARGLSADDRVFINRGFNLVMFFFVLVLVMIVVVSIIWGRAVMDQISDLQRQLTTTTTVQG